MTNGDADGDAPSARRPLETHWGIGSAIAGGIGALVAIIALVVQCSGPPTTTTPTPGPVAATTEPSLSLSPTPTPTSTTTPPPPTTTEPPPPPPPPPVAGTVRHRGPLVLIYGPEADLDDPASNIKWTDDNRGGDIYLGQNGSLLVAGGIKTSGPITSPQNYESCSTNPRLQVDQGIDRGEVKVGTYLCLQTDEHRYVALRITRVIPPVGQDPRHAEIDLDVTSYDPPDV